MNAKYFSLVWAFVFTQVKSLYLEGRLSSEKDWAFLGRFCFLSDIGRLQFKFSYPAKQCCHNLLLYYDDGIQWPSVYQNNSKNCYEKEKALHNADYQIINLTTSMIWSGCELKNTTDALYLYCDAGRSFHSVRARWWYMAISNCKRGEKKEGIDLKYDMKLTNGHSFWTKHFSADEFGILEANIFFLLLFFIMLVMSIIVAVNLRERKLLHSTYKIFIVCVLLEVFGLLVMCISYIAYASNGIANKGLNIVGESLGSIAELLFLLLLLLLAKGFTITRGRLSYNGTIKLSVFVTVYAVIDIILFLYEYVFFDPGLVLYSYESPAGYGWIALRLTAWMWFTIGIVFTLKHYPEKNGFYYPLYAVYTVWFYAVPIMALVATYSIPKYMRAKVVNGMERLIDFVAYAVFLTLMRPQAANKNFPYHVRTTQISAATAESEHVTSFRHNVYEDASGDQRRATENVFNLFTVNTNLSSTDAEINQQKLRDSTSALSSSPPVLQIDENNGNNTKKMQSKS